jgi:polyisoprenoid-binding protein YceI
MRRWAFILILFSLCVPLAFAGQSYVVDQSRSQAKFYIRHFAETVDGTFNRVTGSIVYDPADFSKSKVHVAIKISSVDTHSSQRDRHLQGDEFFDARNFPEMVFNSARVEKRASGMVAVGSFTMRGTTKTIEVPFTLNFASNGRLTVHGTTALNRRDYHVGSEEIIDNQITLGNEVKVELDIQATLAE